MGRHNDRGRAPRAANSQGPSLLLSMAAAILVTGVVFGSAGLANRGNSRAQQQSVDPGSNVPVAPVRTASASVQPPASPMRATVEIRWTYGESWVRVIDSKGAIVLNDVLPKGTVKRFTGPSFFVEMGNAGAITLIEKGGPPISAGKVGETARFTVIGP